jgi:hypothetical protein
MTIKAELNSKFIKASEDRDYCDMFFKGGRDLIEGDDQHGDPIVLQSVNDLEFDNEEESEHYLAILSIMSQDADFRKGMISFEGHVKNSGIKREIEEAIPENTELYWNETRMLALRLGDYFAGITAPNINIDLPTEEQAIINEMMPKWISIHANDVPFWEQEPNTWRLTKIMIKERRIENDILNGTAVEVITFIFWTDREWLRFEELEDGSLNQIDGGANPWGAVPFVRLNSVFDTVSVCNKARQILFREKICLSNTSLTGHTQYVASGLADHGDVDAQHKADLITLTGEGKLETIGVDSSTMEQNRLDLMEARRLLKKTLFLPIEDTNNQSGISKREDKQVLYSTLVNWSTQIELAENFLGKLGWGNSYSATYPKSASDFIVETESELNEMISEAIESGMPKDYINALRKKLVSILDPSLAQGINFDELPILTKERIESIMPAVDLLPDPIVAEFLGIDEADLTAAKEKSMNDQSARELAIIKGGFPEDEEQEAAGG